MNHYRVTAATGNVSEDSYEVLGEAHGRIYPTFASAKAAVDQLRADAADLGYADVTYGLVEVPRPLTPKSPSAVHRMIAAARHSGLRSAILGLDGCPVGGWAETAQAMSRIRDELPEGYRLSDVLRALTTLDHADRYRVTIGGAS